jgi:hypothetical protein
VIDIDNTSLFPEGGLPIPDAIEPYRGYKVLKMLVDGTLASPQESVRWPAKEKLVAACTARAKWGWIPHPGPRPPFLKGYEPTEPEPTNLLPEGWSWHWRQYTHRSPEEQCRCGVYVVKDPFRALRYMRGPAFIMAEVALWGKVIPADEGARGEFAYPIRLLAPHDAVDACRPTSLRYGIPVLVLDPPELQEVNNSTLTVDVTGLHDVTKKSLMVPHVIAVSAEDAAILNEQVVAALEAFIRRLP